MKRQVFLRYRRALELNLRLRTNPHRRAPTMPVVPVIPAFFTSREQTPHASGHGHGFEGIRLWEFTAIKLSPEAFMFSWLRRTHTFPNFSRLLLFFLLASFTQVYCDITLQDTP